MDAMTQQDNIQKKGEEAAQAAAPPKSYIDPSLLDPAANEEMSAEDLSAQLAETKDKLLRALAEVENMRRRSEQNVKEASVYAIAKFANDMLSIGDNLRRALESAPPEIRTDKIAASLLEGVEITERSLLQTLERYQVKQIETQDAKFDPNFHQAMYEVETSEKPPGTIMHVIQTGYKIGDRMLRPALVGVAKAKVS